MEEAITMEALQAKVTDLEIVNERYKQEIEQFVEKVDNYQKCIAEYERMVKEKETVIRHMANMNQKAYKVIVDLSYKIKAYETQKKYDRVPTV